MATNKNQHFVPRCYLRPFSHEAANKCINVFNFDRDKFIPLAPVKSQCSGDYFYGRDPALDDAIRVMEGAYASAIREVLAPGYELTGDHRLLLTRFWLLQHLRTDAASRRAVEMFDDAFGEVAQKTGFRMQIRDAVQMAMRVFASDMDIASDLRVVLVRNRSRIPFVTSDHPAALTNRWYLHNVGKRTEIPHSFGLHSGGNVLLLPLSPSVMFLAYDSHVHSVAHKNGWMEIRDDADADALNQHQYLNARANLFLRDAESLGLVREAFARVADRRPRERFKTTFAAHDRTVNGASRYIPVPRDDPRAREGRVLVVSQTIHPCPSSWPKFLGWRANACVYSNGSGVGYVRRRFVRTDGSVPPFKKLAPFFG